MILVVFTLAAFIGGLAAAGAWYDFRSDRQHPQAAQTYRVLITGTQGDRQLTSSSTPRDMAARLRDASGAIQASTAVVLKTVDVQLADGRPPRPLRVLYVDDDFPKVFSFGIDRRDLSDLEAAGGLRLTRSAALRLGLTQGATIQLVDHAYPLLPPLPDPADNGHLQYDAIAPIALLARAENITRGDIFVINDQDAATYAVIQKDRLDEAFRQIDAVRNDLVPAFNMKAELQPLQRIRLDPAPESDAAADLFVTGRAQDLYAAIALALIAFVGALSCAALLVRAVVEREGHVLGILRAVGRTPAMINARLFFELSAIALVSLLIATILALLTAPAMFARLDKHIGWIAVLAACLLVAGPALLLMVASNCLLSMKLVERPIPQLLAGGLGAPKLIGAGSAVIVLQAGLLMSVVFVALFVGGQLDRAVETSKGFADVWRVEVQRPEEVPRLRNVLDASTQVRRVIATSWAPYSSWAFTSPVRLPEQDIQNSVQAGLLWADDDVTDLLGLQLIAGARLSKRDAGACRAVANEALIRGLGIDSPAAAIGRTVQTLTGQGHFGCVISGVVADARYRTARLPLSPALHILADPSDPNFRQNYLLLASGPGMTSGQIQTLLGPGGETVLPQQIKALERRAYQTDRRLLQALLLAAGLVFLSVSATFASAVALMIEERVVEIGIRRTLGFSWLDIGLILMRPLAGLTALGVVLAAPLATWAALRWSAGLQQPVLISISGLAICGVVVLAPLAIALAVNWQRLSRISPAQVLRS